MVIKAVRAKILEFGGKDEGWRCQFGCRIRERPGQEQMTYPNEKREESFMKGPYKVVGRELRRANRGWQSTPELATEVSHSQP